jgi:hypothetical protein
VGSFDSEFTSEKPLDSVVEDSHLSETVQQQFAGALPFFGLERAEANARRL